jgi:hypothetical protein
MSSESHVPSNEELRAELLILKSENPTLGIVKTHARLLSTHPGWSVSEKRVRKIIKELGNDASPPNGDGGEEETDPTHTHMVYPTSRVIEKLDVGKWTNKVQVRYFSRKKGKGLVAKERIETGEVIWKEDPFVIAPEWSDTAVPHLIHSKRERVLTKGIAAGKLLISSNPQMPAAFARLRSRAR